MLTLSATPIPRTLNMALSGIRDMSVIEEAPHDRHPVQTYVLEYDTGVIGDAIRRELRRGGQVYYLHNDVASLQSTVARIQQMAPEARIGVGHGKMNEEDLSEVWRQLLDHEIDVLVCTTIIETGVDVPSANTLIIENADRMGLSQLHQLRGRGGAATAGPTPTSPTPPTRPFRRLPRSGFRPSGSLRSSALALRLPCGTWKSGARGTS